MHSSSVPKWSFPSAKLRRPAAACTGCARPAWMTMRGRPPRWCVRSLLSGATRARWRLSSTQSSGRSRRTSIERPRGHRAEHHRTERCQAVWTRFVRFDQTQRREAVNLVLQPGERKVAAAKMPAVSHAAQDLERNLGVHCHPARVNVEKITLTGRGYLMFSRLGVDRTDEHATETKQHNRPCWTVRAAIP